MNYEIIDNNLYKNYSYLKNVINKTLEHESAKDAYLDIIFVDDKEIKNINKEYRDNDKVTDVISFAFEDNKDLPKNIRLLGSIYVCIPKMIEQAKEYGHSEKRELSFLVCHGLLHLLGYDHVNSKKEEKIMFSLQDEILDSLDIRR